LPFEQSHASPRADDRKRGKMGTGESRLAETPFAKVDSHPNPETGFAAARTISTMIATEHGPAIPDRDDGGEAAAQAKC